nr:hypothetical protein [Roseburia sp. AF25-25LB]
MSTLNLTLLTDLYEMTMMQGYFKTGNRDVAVFDAFYRTNPCDGGYAVCAGLDQMIDYIKNLHFDEEDISYLRSLSIFDEDFLTYLSNFKFSGDIYAIPEGTLIFPREPLVKVVAPIMEAQLIETAVLNIINHQSLIATKAARVCYAAQGDGVMEFGLRRAQVLIPEPTVPELLLSAAVKVLPTSLPVRCLTSRYLEPTPIAGL